MLPAPSVVPPGAAPLRLRGHTFDAATPAVMAIINRTPDSFFDGNRHADLDAAKRALDAAVADGADIVDVGGVRAGQLGDPVGAAEEIDRVLPFLLHARATYPDLVLSLDSWRSEVGLTAAQAGIDLVNDTWAGHDPNLATVAARIGAGYVVSHTGGLPPRTDPEAVTYPPEPDGVLADVLAALADGARRAEEAGVPRERIVVDPTLDFGKTTAHSLTVLRATADVVALGLPVLQAISRKDFIGESLGLLARDRLEGSLAATAVAAWLGVAVFRTHDVQATRRVLDMVATLRGDRAPSLTLRGVPSHD